MLRQDGDRGRETSSGRSGRSPKARLLALADRLPRARVGVVGDLVADVYVYGKPARLSREAPVVVASYEGEEMVPGSAANTANNLAALGVPAWPVGIVGDDGPGKALKRHFEREGAIADGILVEPGLQTITKTRICLGDLHRSRHQVLRIDRDPDLRMTRDREARLLEAFSAADRRVNAWVVSDYSYPLLTPRVIAAIRRAARRKIVVVDSHDRLLEFPGVEAVTPNHEEALRLLGLKDNRLPAEEVGRALLRRVRARRVLLTLGKDGMVLVERTRTARIPAAGSDEAVDVSGCGDTVAAVFTAALAAGCRPLEAAQLANFAASVVVMKPRTATLTREELKAAILNAF